MNGGCVLSLRLCVYPISTGIREMSGNVNDDDENLHRRVLQLSNNTILKIAQMEKMANVVEYAEAFQERNLQTILHIRL